MSAPVGPTPEELAAVLVAVRVVAARDHSSGSGTGRPDAGAGNGATSVWADRRYGLRPALGAPLVRGSGRDAWRASGWPV